jgi:exopolyphosphatase/guanosine-5'-triphosphate,3'-diphosphate pyrophosphatase
MTIATIDIGTNTVLMLISKCNGNDCQTIAHFHDIARLGEGVNKSEVISQESLDRLIIILNNFKQKCNDYNCDRIIVTGTSVFRDAWNSLEVIREIKNQTGLYVLILSGDDEAKYSFAGAVECEEKSGLIDIGGGSTEVVVGINDEIIYAKSIDIGAVRITEKFFSNQPPTPIEIKNAKDFITQKITDELDFSYFKEIKKFYGVAGTVTTIAATVLKTTDEDVTKYEGFNLKSNDVDSVYDKYIHSTTSEIINNYKVHPKRADLISAGSLILISLFELLNLNEIIVSSKGLRYGILKHLDKF